MMLNLTNRYAITLDEILFLDKQLKNFARMTYDDVHKIWFDFNNDEHMALHMARRFINTGLSDPGVFFASCHGESQQILYLKYNFAGNRIIAVIEFFKYIKCGLGKSDIKIFFEDDLIVYLWKSYNSIDFFFSLKSDQQLILVDHYNAHAY